MFPEDGELDEPDELQEDKISENMQTRNNKASLALLPIRFSFFLPDDFLCIRLPSE
jgi:hypothetical protein